MAQGGDVRQRRELPDLFCRLLHVGKEDKERSWSLEVGKFPPLDEQQIAGLHQDNNLIYYELNTRSRTYLPLFSHIDNWQLADTQVCSKQSHFKECGGQMTT